MPARPKAPGSLQASLYRQGGVHADQADLMLKGSLFLEGYCTWTTFFSSWSRPTFAPEFAARYISGSWRLWARSAAARNMACSRGLRAPAWKVMSFATAMACRPCGHSGVRSVSAHTTTPTSLLPIARVTCKTSRSMFPNPHQPTTQEAPIAAMMRREHVNWGKHRLVRTCAGCLHRQHVCTWETRGGQCLLLFNLVPGDRN